MKRILSFLLRNRVCALIFLLLSGGVCSAEPPVDGATVGTARLRTGEAARPAGLMDFMVEFEHLGTASIPGRGAFSLPVTPEFPSGSYRLSLRKTESGFTYAVENGEGEGFAGMRMIASGPAAPEDAAALCDMLNRLETARLDGWHRSNSALGCSFTLQVRYAGGETINASGRGGASVLPPSCWHPEAYLSFFNRLAASQGRRFGSDRISAENTGPLTLIAVRFALHERKNGIPAGMHDYQIFREGRGIGYSYIYRRTYDDYARVFGKALKSDLEAAKAMLSEQDCWAFDGLECSSPSRQGKDSFSLTATFEGGRELAAGGNGDGIPAAWHEEPWFRFFMSVLDARGRKHEREQLFRSADR